MFRTSIKKEEKTLEMADIQPFEYFDENYGITKTGRLFFGFEIFLPQMEQMSERDYDMANGTLSSALSKLPVGTYCHFQNIYYSKTYTPEDKDLGFLAQMNRNFFKEKPMLGHKSYLFITFPDKIEGKQKTKTPVTTLASRPVRMSAKNILYNIEKKTEIAFSAIHPFLSSFNNIFPNSMRLIPLKSSEIKGLLYKYYNLEYRDAYAKNTNRIYRPVLDNQNTLLVGDKLCKVISVIQQPKSVYTYMYNGRNVVCPFTEPLGIAFYRPHITNQVFMVCDTESKLKNLERMGNNMRSFGAWGNTATRVQGEEVQEFVRDMRQRKEALVEMSYNIMLFHESEKVMIDSVSETLTAFEALGMDAMIENMNLGALYMANMPGNAEHNFHYMLMTAREGACYTNLTTSYRSQEGGVFFCDREGRPVLLDMWNGHKNKNMIIVGPSGTGKSFLTNHIIAERHENGDVQLIIDVGDLELGSSYISLVKNLGGLYYEYNQERPISFNPFEVQKTDTGLYSLSVDKTDFLIQIMQVILLEESQGFEKNPGAILKDLIQSYYRMINENRKEYVKDKNSAIGEKRNYSEELQYSLFASFDGFYHYVMGIDKERSQKDHPLHEEHMQDSQSLKFDHFRNICKQFAKGGDYYSILNGEGDSISFEKYTLMCFDLATIKNNKTLYPIVSVVILELAFEMLTKYSKERKHIYMDEAWSMLSGNMLEFVIYMYRTIRKLGGSMTIITQGISEILATGAAGDSIILNSHLKIMLDHSGMGAKQDKEERAKQMNELSNAFALSTQDQTLLASIQEKTQTRSEFMIKIGGTSSRVYSLEVSPYSFLAFNTDKDIKNRLTEIIRDLTKKDELRRVSHDLLMSGEHANNEIIEKALHIMVSEMGY